MRYAHVRDTTVEPNGNLQIHGLPLPCGTRVQVVILRKDDVPAAALNYPLNGEPVRYVDPFGPATDPADWEVNR